MDAQFHLTLSQILSDLIKCAADAYDNHSSQNPSSSKKIKIIYTYHSRKTLSFISPNFITVVSVLPFHWAVQGLTDIDIPISLPCLMQKSLPQLSQVLCPLDR
jgi:hypothetical protein